MPNKTYTIEPSYSVLNDRRSERFADLYSIFMAKIARLPLERALSSEDEARLMRLFAELNAAKRREEN